MYQQLWGYKVEEKLYLGVREQKRLNTTALGEVSGWRLPFAISSQGHFREQEFLLIFKKVFVTTVQFVLYQNWNESSNASKIPNIEFRESLSRAGMGKLFCGRAK
jgi:hypothetical protein